MTKESKALVSIFHGQTACKKNPFTQKGEVKLPPKSDALKPHAPYLNPKPFSSDSANYSPSQAKLPLKRELSESLEPD